MQHIYFQLSKLFRGDNIFVLSHLSSVSMIPSSRFIQIKYPDPLRQQSRNLSLAFWHCKNGTTPSWHVDIIPCGTREKEIYFLITCSWCSQTSTSYVRAHNNTNVICSTRDQYKALWVVGDFILLWNMNTKRFWNQSTVLQDDAKVLGMQDQIIQVWTMYHEWHIWFNHWPWEPRTSL